MPRKRSRHREEQAARAAAQEVDSALDGIRSLEDAERVLDQVEREHNGETQEDAARASSAHGEPPAEALQDTARSAGASGRAADALAAAVQESTAESGPSDEELSEALRKRMLDPARNRLKPHRYLQDAALRRMSILQAWDATAFVAVNHLPRNPYFVKGLRFLATVTNQGMAWAAGSLVLAAVGGRRGRRASLEMLAALGLTTAVVERIVKVYFRRRRPFVTLVKAMVVGRKPGSWSFPSGHTATSFACASALSRSYRRKRPVLYGIASVVGFSRVYLGHHYPVDVLSGATIGELISRLVGFGIRRLRR